MLDGLFRIVAMSMSCPRRKVLRMSVQNSLRLSFFFFQAEDGIRDLIVTGVQTCALPICPGARDGLRKCFRSLGGLNETEAIRMVTDRQYEEFESRGLQFRNLWGRALQLIDCQNIFCEVDKYARVKHPDAKGISGRIRIKR